MSDQLTVWLTGLEAFGRHGVFPAETELGQRFVVDLEITLADGRAAVSDDLADTVDYGALAAAVAERIAGEPVALLEHLAAEIADLAMADRRAAAVSVTVHKPHVALSQVVQEAAVTLTRRR